MATAHPPPVPQVSQLEIVVHGHSPPQGPPVPPVSQLETVVHGHSPPTTSTTGQPAGDCGPRPQSTTRTTSTTGPPAIDCGPWPQPTTSNTCQLPATSRLSDDVNGSDVKSMAHSDNLNIDALADPWGRRGDRLP